MSRTHPDSGGSCDYVRYESNHSGVRIIVEHHPDATAAEYVERFRAFLVAVGFDDGVVARALGETQE